MLYVQEKTKILFLFFLPNNKIPYLYTPNMYSRRRHEFWWSTLGPRYANLCLKVVCLLVILADNPCQAPGINDWIPLYVPLLDSKEISAMDAEKFHIITTTYKRLDQCSCVSLVIKLMARCLQQYWYLNLLGLSIQVGSFCTLYCFIGLAVCIT